MSTRLSKLRKLPEDRQIVSLPRRRKELRPSILSSRVYGFLLLIIHQSQCLKSIHAANTSDTPRSDSVYSIGLMQLA